MLAGMIPAMITPTIHQRVNMDVLEAYTNWLVEQGAHGLFPLGTTGEGQLIPHDDWHQALQVVIRTVNHRIPVVVQCGGIGLSDTKWRMEAAVAAGTDGVALMAPYFYNYKPADLEAYFDEILTTWSKVPAYLYNIPKYTHVEITPDVYVRLLKKHENLLGVKDSSGSLEIMKSFIDAAPHKAVLSGSDATVAEAYREGAAGIVSGVAAACPHVAVQAWERLKTGDSEGANLMKEIRDAFHHTSTVQAARAVLEYAGFPVGESFQPLPSIQRAARDELVTQLQRLGVLSSSEVHGGKA